MGSLLEHNKLSVTKSNWNFVMLSNGDQIMYRVVILILCIVILTGCAKDDNDNGSTDNQYEYEEEMALTFEISDQTFLELSNENGNILIVGSDTASGMYLDITKKVKSNYGVSDIQAYIDNINITSILSTEGVKIVVEQPGSSDLNYYVDFSIVLPLHFDFYINCGNGNIDLQAHSRNVFIQMGNGSTITDLVLADTCSVSLSLGNGNLSVLIPDTTNAALSAFVGNGSVTSSGLTFQNQQSTNTQLSGKLGNGHGLITLSVGNGNIELHGK